MGMKKPLLGLVCLAVLLAAVILPQPAANPIARINGFGFILFYCCIIAVVLGLCRAIARSLDTTGRLSPPPMPKDPEPYEIAYLRAGTNEVTRLAFFNLIQHHYLSVQQEDKIAQFSEHPTLSSLSPLNRDIFHWFSSPRPARELFLPSLVHCIEQHCTEYHQNLHIKKLLFNCPQQAIVAFWLGRGTIAGLGTYKLILTLLNSQFQMSFVLAIAIVAALIILQRLCKMPRLSHRGNKYLAILQRTFEGLNVSQGDIDSNNLAVAVFGLSILAKTPYAFLEQLLPSAKTTQFPKNSHSIARVF
jgi:uncharacterized protein (TIGR04222 family)